MKPNEWVQDPQVQIVQAGLYRKILGQPLPPVANPERVQVK